MLTDKDVLEYVQQVQAQKGGGEERVPGVSTALGKFLTERCGSVANFMSGRVRQAQSDGALDGFARLKKIRRALAALDRGRWERSYHQRLFHEHFMNAIVRVLFKTDSPGAFQRAYPRLLEVNEWKETYQECLISTPRRFGKTISVCLFVAALLYSAPNVEISIYSTCKRISQKLLRNCMRFLDIVHTVLGEEMPSFLKQTSDEVEIQGGEGKSDYRRLNSYPSKVLPVCGCAACVFGVFALFFALFVLFVLFVVCSVARDAKLSRRVAWRGRLSTHALAPPHAHIKTTHTVRQDPFE